MKLIDVDKLVVDARLGEGEIPYVSKAQIDEAPTVEAIPIEWLEKWFTEKHKRAIIWWDCAEGVFKAFMEDWRAENESDKTE